MWGDSYRREPSSKPFFMITPCLYFRQMIQCNLKGMGIVIGVANTDFLLFIGTQCRLKLFLTAIACILIACALQLVLCCSCIQQVACSYICSISQLVWWYASNSTVHCSSSSTLAFASSCAIDQWHRPSAGYLTLCSPVSKMGAFSIQLFMIILCIFAEHYSKHRCRAHT